MVNNNNNNEGFWWNEQVDDMGIDQLEEFMSALGELKKKVTMRADELSMINGSSSSNSSMKIARFGAEDQFMNRLLIITIKAKRHVTFSKRRLGLFKKASELCILTGAEIAILVQSLKRQRLFTFGHPSADSVIDRYLNGKSSSSTVNQLNMQMNNQSIILDL
ncbi:hypothetical protein RND71_041582 [Anisodus tanguticus]|uniref:MADS-box domain-containing protein n=1 Tax=Anisodus tanguticus TaxID=243964 RepID=A0AAE1UWW2_9SOLA|nr:hypothetical protein RND71_041582 [Anisodus tanguticus]